MYKSLGLIPILLTALTMGCTSSSTDSAVDSDSSGGQLWVATTGQVHDALQNIAEGVDVEMKLLCGPGIDPHSYAASPGDVEAMSNADAIFYNGFHLEAKLHDALHHDFADKAFSMASVFPEDVRLDWVEDGEIDPEAPFDPHIWNHLPAWQTCVKELTEHVASIDPANADTYRANGEKYAAEIASVHENALEKFEAMGEGSRVLVSAHDAFNYFATVYGFESVAVLGVGNDAEADVKTMRDVAKTVCDKKVPVIFLETITNPKVTEALQEACEARDWSVKIADQPLYSDDLGSEPPQNTFLGAFQSNVDLIAESLGGKE
ncbi:MAG: zinc ABC transporter substrate-binding protein [Planctomycetota bacterium]